MTLIMFMTIDFASCAASLASCRAVDWANMRSASPLLLWCLVAGVLRRGGAWLVPTFSGSYGHALQAQTTGATALSTRFWGATVPVNANAQRLGFESSARVPAVATGMAATDTGVVESESEVCEGDVVVVVGASGGVGRLVAQSLAVTGRYKLRGVVRNLDKAREALGDAAEGMELEQANILDEKSLGAAMKNAACVVACTGTTAFPSARWAKGNTPDAVDNLAIGNMLRAAVDPTNHPDGGKLKRFVLLSSVGVERRDKFPFPILNAFGVLDAKAKGEEAVRTAAKEGGFAYSILRPGQIVGEPFTVYSNGVAKPAPAPEKPDKNSAKRMVSLKQGDEEAAEVNPSSVAAAFTQAVQQPGAAGKSFTVVNVKGPDPSQDDWDRLYSQL